jgi:hypothetical protein
MTQNTGLEADFWRIFARTLGRTFEPGRHEQPQIPEWDSLRHVELIFEIEEKFGIEIPPQCVAELFSDTDTIIAYLRARVAAAR